VRIQPRQQLLDTWRAIARASYQGKNWSWGGRDKPNSIADAEQLLCIMYPATQIPGFKLDLPDETAEDVLDSLRSLGDSVEIPKLLIGMTREYLRNYTDETGTPIFSGGSYFGSSVPGSDLTPDQRALDVVDSYSMSVSLALATLGFVRVFRRVVTRDKLRREIDELEVAASRRLTAAMVGLLRSFTVNVFEPDSPAGQVLRRNINQAGLSDRRVLEDLQEALKQVRASLGEVAIGSGQAENLDNPNLLFECGWTWGVVENAPTVELAEEIGPQPEGLARIGPYLYFTINALDGIEDLFSDRTRILGLLNQTQQRLAQLLQLRYTWTQSYWSTIATFGHGRWPIEDIPWQTVDGQESDYFSLLVTSIAVQDLLRRRATDVDLGRVARILEDLASRGRITRRPLHGDPAIGLHAPGVHLTLIGSEHLGPAMTWQVSDFAALLLKRTVKMAELARSTELRNQLLDLADQIWGHLLSRRLKTGGARDLWDQTQDAFPTSPPQTDLPSWYFTERVVECLVAAANVVLQPPLRSRRLVDYAADLLNEAEHLFDRELLDGSSEAGHSMRTSLQQVRLSLQRARVILDERPGSAAALATDVLRELDLLAAARQDLSEV
jgi:hypothetical protein